MSGFDAEIVAVMWAVVVTLLLQSYGWQDWRVVVGVLGLYALLVGLQGLARLLSGWSA